MTEKLKTLLDRAADTDFAPPDLDAITRNGDRTVRRRRTGLAAAALAVVVAAGGGVALALGDGSGSGRDDAVVVGEPAPLTGITWAADGAIHTADGGTYEVGHPVAAYVRTSVGYAFSDGDGTVFSYVDGVVEPMGSVGTGYRGDLFADPEGSLVGWIDPSGAEPVFVVHDLAEGFETRFGDAPDGLSAEDEFPPFELYAIDGRTAYVRDARGAVAVDVDSGEVTVLEPRPAGWYRIKGAEDGLVAFEAPTGDSSEAGTSTVIGASPTDGVGLAPGWGGPAYFSPDGRWVSLEGDEPAVYDTATGEQVAIDVGDRPFATGAEWLDDDTLMTLAASRNVGPLEVLTCEVPSGTCTVTVPDLGLFEDLEGRIAFADGMATG